MACAGQYKCAIISYAMDSDDRLGIRLAHHNRYGRRECQRLLYRKPRRE